MEDLSWDFLVVLVDSSRVKDLREANSLVHGLMIITYGGLILRETVKKYASVRSFEF